MSEDVLTRPRVSVVVPVLNAAATLGECLRALADQGIPTAHHETIVVIDSRSTDQTEAIARASGFRVLVHEGTNAGSGRNAGVSLARGEWIAFTDGDCVPTRNWLRELLRAVDDGRSFAATGPTVGLRSDTPAARFVDLTGGLDAERHMAHSRYPWAPTANVMYRRDALLAIGGFDERFRSYEGCDLHTRVRRSVQGEFAFAPKAVVFHRHRSSWRAYWKQQVNYGRGYAQFFLRYREELPWSAADEARTWGSVIAAGTSAVLRPRGDAGLVRRGRFVKALAQRRGFATTYWRMNAHDGWSEPAQTRIGSAR